MNVHGCGRLGIIRELVCGIPGTYGMVVLRVKNKYARIKKNLDVCIVQKKYLLQPLPTIWKEVYFTIEHACRVAPSSCHVERCLLTSLGLPFFFGPNSKSALQKHV